MDTAPPCPSVPLEHVDRAEARLQELADLASAGVAAGMVSHEVRNLLTPAAAYLQLALRDRTLAAGTRASLERANIAMQRACEVAELVVSLARVAPPEQACDLSVAIDECLDLLGWSTKAPVRLSVAVHAGMSVAIGPDALRHVLLNLLLNARASIANDAGIIRIGAVGSARNLVLEIEDNGRGIPPATLNSIRECLLHPKVQPTPLPSGGLGLLLCRRLLDAHHGTLEIESVPGSGTLARLTLPIPNKMQSLIAA